MRFLLFVFLICAVCGDAFARMKYVSQQHLPKYNMLLNPGGENGVQRWAKTGSSTLAVDTSTPMMGAASLQWDASAASEYLTSSSTGATIPLALRGRPCEIRMTYFYTSGSAGDIQMYAYDGSDEVHEKFDLPVTDATSPTEARAAFNCPSSGSLRFRLESTADAGTIEIDSMWVGSNLAQGEQCVTSGWLAWTPSQSQGFGTITNITLEYRRDCNTMYIRGGWTNGTVAASEAQIELPDSLTIGGTSTNAELVGIEARGTVTNLTLTVIGTKGDTFLNFGRSNEAATNQINPLNGNSSWANTERQSLFASVPIQEWSGNQTVVNLDTTPMYFSAYHEDDCLWSRTNAAYGDPAIDASCTFTEVLNKNFGTVVSHDDGTPNNNLPGLAWLPREKGAYNICLTTSFLTTTTAHYPAIRLRHNGTDTLWETETRTNSAAEDPASPCAIFEVVNLNEQILTLQTKASAGAAQIDVSAIRSTIEWIIYPISQNLPQPYAITNGVKSTQTDGVRMNSAHIEMNSGTPTVAREDGDWISSLSDDGVGATTITVNTDIFSTTPNCTLGFENNDQCGNVNPTSTTSIAVGINECDTPATVQDEDFSIICVGSK